MTCTQCNTQVSASLLICPNCFADLTSMPGSEHLQQSSPATAQAHGAVPVTRSHEPEPPKPPFEPKPSQIAQPPVEQSTKVKIGSNTESSKKRNTIRKVAPLFPFAAIAVVLISSIIMFRDDTFSLIFLIVVSALTLVPFFMLFNAKRSQFERRVVFTILAAGIVIGLIFGGNFAINVADEYEPERYTQGITFIIAGILYGTGCLAALVSPKIIDC